MDSHCFSYGFLKDIVYERMVSVRKLQLHHQCKLYFEQKLSTYQSDSENVESSKFKELDAIIKAHENCVMSMKYDDQVIPRTKRSNY